MLSGRYRLLPWACAAQSALLVTAVVLAVVWHGGGFRHAPPRILIPTAAPYEDERSEYRSTHPSPGCVVVMGDSTAAYPMVYLERRFAEGGPTFGWGDLFASRRVCSRAIPGDTITALHRRIGDVIPLRPARVLLLVGANDLHSGRSAEELATEYGQIVGELVTTKARVTALSVLPTRIDDPSLSPARVMTINLAIRAAAERSGATFVDLWPYFASNGKMIERYTYDGIHLSTAGVDKWAEAVRPLVD